MERIIFFFFKDWGVKLDRLVFIFIKICEEKGHIQHRGMYCHPRNTSGGVYLLRRATNNNAPSAFSVQFKWMDH